MRPKEFATVISIYLPPTKYFCVCMFACEILNYKDMTCLLMFGRHYGDESINW